MHLYNYFNNRALIHLRPNRISSIAAKFQLFEILTSRNQGSNVKIVKLINTPIFRSTKQSENFSNDDE